MCRFTASRTAGLNVSTPACRQAGSFRQLELLVRRQQLKKRNNYFVNKATNNNYKDYTTNYIT
jgi:hypothetical protein